ncbi:MAG: SsrA-binding protein SmpB [Parachlamydiaceae bacterium]
MSHKNLDLVSNRRATFDYEILEVFEAGIVLQGTEIKSLRNHGGNLQDAYVRVVGQEAFLIGCNISLYSFGNIHNHEEKRDRKLLLHKREIAQLKKAAQEKGLTLIPLGIYLKNGRAKAKVGLAKGKKTYDKRQAIKEREDNRQIAKLIKESR